MTKEQIKDEFIKEFAPCGFIEKDEEQVVPIIIDWCFSKIDSILQSQKDELVEKIEGMGFVDRNEAGQFALHTDGYNQAIEDIISLIKQDK